MGFLLLSIEFNFSACKAPPYLYIKHPYNAMINIINMHQISILEQFLKNHVTLKTGRMLKISFASQELITFWNVKK